MLSDTVTLLDKVKKGTVTKPIKNIGKLEGILRRISICIGIGIDVGFCVGVGVGVGTGIDCPLIRIAID
ncbi:hypothetical protein PFICI_01583 [Pestalotiopsis fici W106-1]|uniref:Uncharacterized protein n=1 Tax=Pestalotiopsis fici (strain W106-1 / CGMCC3.15140) TaxID=1229662 RepID=W3XP79_PESFW|nr:uncharacterized protein PFICI_01583 [Pestalotiopsis fici W106-1]ETS87755.1 hypothetical protein PFICI_01583 [Pestalotiopsis fici W106-1]